MEHDVPPEGLGAWRPAPESPAYGFPLPDPPPPPPAPRTPGRLRTGLGRIWFGIKFTVAVIMFILGLLLTLSTMTDKIVRLLDIFSGDDGHHVSLSIPDDEAALRVAPYRSA